MDIRRLVNRITDALGPDADPARVEAVAAVVLETLEADAPAATAKKPGERVIVTAYGLDKPGILAGITRNIVMELARKRGITVTEKALVRDDLYAAHECFLTGTAAEIIAVTSIDGRQIGHGKPGEITKQWFIVDATDKIVGRLASDIAVVLMGKHRPTYTPHVDSGDFVVVTSAEKVKLTGNKWEQKTYTWYTGYPGLKSETAARRLKNKPEHILREAVRRMLPKNRLGRKMLAKLKVYAGPDHPHQAQQPEPREMGRK